MATVGIGAATNLSINDILDEAVSENIKIDIDTLNTNAEEYAQDILSKVTALFEDELWMETHIDVAGRLKIEYESLRGLVKMRQADEYVHDALLKAISSDNSKSALYRALAEIQKTSLNITTKINETIEIINNLMRGWQLDYGENIQDDENIIDGGEKRTFRGSKDFINAQNKNL